MYEVHGYTPASAFEIVRSIVMIRAKEVPKPTTKPAEAPKGKTKAKPKAKPKAKAKAKP